MVRSLLNESIKAALKNLKFPEIDFKIDYPKEEFGDYSTNVAMVLSKTTKKSAVEIAERIIKNLPKIDFVKNIEIAGPGFINFYLKPEWVSSSIKEIISTGSKFGSVKIGQNKKVQVEFISANPTGPLHLGNGRGGFFGDVLASVLKKAGYKVDREYYVNDAPSDNVQMQTLGKSVLAEAGAIEFKEGYKGTYIKEIVEKIKKMAPEAIELKSVPLTASYAAQILVDLEIKPTIKKMGISFDNFFNESSLYKDDLITKTIERLAKKGLTYEKEEALWFKATEFGDTQDWVVRKHDGTFTYLASDIPYHLNKFETRKYDKVIDIWGADHAGHVGNMKAAMKVFGYDDKLDILICQFVRLVEKDVGKKMSKRAGEYVTLNELLDQVGPDVVRFFVIMRSLDTHMDFDLELAKEHSEKNPVFYVQYAFARIHGILAKAAVGRQTSANRESKSEVKLTHPAELSLIKELWKLPEIVEDTARDYQVQRLPFYAINLATKFHDFYEKCRVISDDKDLTTARLKLVEATKIVLKNTLDLIGIKAPERM